MPDIEKTIKGLMCIAGDLVFCAHCKYSDVNGSGRGDRCKRDCAKDALALLKEHEKATIEPKRIDLPNETKAWLDKMDAVDALGNIADICMDWDGYRTANGLGGLINEIWAYARYCADRLPKAQEPIEARLHLCDSCTKLYPECDATADGIEFGCGVGNDNIIGCTAYENRWKAQEPRLVTESDFNGADEDGYIPAWTEEKDGDMYCECIQKAAITDPDGIGVFRYWTSRPDQATREATPWN